MTNPLDRLLGKKGLKYEELNPEERQTFNVWRDSLTGRKLTDEDVRAFLSSEYHDAVRKLTVKGLNEREDIFLKMKVDFIIQVREFLALPEKEMLMASRQIESQL